MGKAILQAALGGTPCAVASLQCLVGFPALEVIDAALDAMFHDRKVSMLQMTVIRAWLRRTVAGPYKDYW